MHAFTMPSQQLRNKVWAALLHIFHQTSLYRRLVLTAKADGSRTKETGQAIHMRLISQPEEGTTILEFPYGQLYNGKLAKRYGHAPTHEYPLYYQHDSCTHIEESVLIKITSSSAPACNGP